MFQLDNQYFIDLAIEDRGLKIDESMLNEISIIESIDQILPTFTLKYVPDSAVFHEILPLTGMEDIAFAIARDRTSLQRQREDYKVTSYEPDKAVRRKFTRPACVIRGVLSPVDFLLDGQRTSYSGTISDVIQDFFGVVTSDIQVDPTHSDLNQTWIQPGWSNMDQLKYWRKRAYSSQLLGPYFSFFRRDGTFMFKTLDGLYKQPLAPEDAVVWSFAKSDETAGKQQKSDVVQNRAGNLITSFDYENKMGIESRHGALGSQSSGYNWEDGEYVEEDANILDIDDHVTLTDKTLFKIDELSTGKHSNSQEDTYTGRVIGGDSEVIGQARANVLDSSRSISQMVVRLRRDIPKVELGSKVFLKIIDEGSSGNFQSQISGQWIIHTKIRNITDEYTMKFVLIRDGVNIPKRLPSRFGDSPGGKVRSSIKLT